MLYQGVNNAWGRYTPKYLAGDIKAGIKGQASKNSKTYKHRCKLCQINQMGQSYSVIVGQPSKFRC